MPGDAPSTGSDSDRGRSAHGARGRGITAVLAILLLAASLFVATAVPAAARADGPTIDRILIIDMIADEADGVIAREASTELALVARQVLTGAEVLDQEDVRRILQTEAERMLLGCQDDSTCLAELGGAMGASHIATGTIRRIGDRYGVDLRLIDSERAMNLRHLRERGIDDVHRVLDVVAILGAHLFDPSQPAEAGFLDIAGSGQLILDGVFIGSAPMRRVRVPTGTRRVVWQAETRVEATVVVEAFATHRVDPSMGRAVRPGGAPPAQTTPPAATRAGPSGPAAGSMQPHDPVAVAGDLGNWRFSSGIGTTAILGFPGTDSVAGGTLTLDVGLTTDSGFDLGVRHRAYLAGTNSENVGFNTTGLGVGYVAGRDLRFRIATHLGRGRWSVHDGGFDGGVVSLDRANRFHGRTGVSWDLGVDLRLALARYFEIGAELGVATVSVANEGTLSSVHALVFWGVPASPGLRRAPSAYRRDRNFWLTAGLVAVGGLITLGGTAYNAFPG
jgi:hypothetical protein